MAIREYPSRTEPFVSQRSPRGRRGPGYGIGAAVLIIILIAAFVIFLYVIPPLMEDVVFPDIGIPYSTLFIIILAIAFIASIYAIVKGGLLESHYALRYKERDPTICKRVIKDGPDGIDIIVSGSKEDTFAQACQADWKFKSANQKSKWYIKDEKGNDVTDRSLETADGIFILIPEYGTGTTTKEEPDKTDEYSSIHDSVTYYD